MSAFGSELRRLLDHLQATLGVTAEEPENALRLVFAPDRLRPAIRNWAEVIRALMPRLERQLRHDPELRDLRDEMLAYPDVHEALEEPARFEEEHSLLVPLEIVSDEEVLSWYTTIASFGGAADVTTQEVVIESLLPANEATRRFAHSVAAAHPP